MNKIFRNSNLQLKTLVLVSSVMLGFMLMGMEGVNGTQVPTTNSVVSVDVSEGNMQPESLEGTSWKLVFWGDPNRLNSVLRVTKITLEFQDGKISGSAGCNRYQGTYERQENRLKINETATTRKACAQEIMYQENCYLDVLQAANRYEISSENELKIFFELDKMPGILIFRPTSGDVPQS